MDNSFYRVMRFIIPLMFFMLTFITGWIVGAKLETANIVSCSEKI